MTSQYAYFWAGMSFVIAFTSKLILGLCNLDNETKRVLAATSSIFGAMSLIFFMIFIFKASTMYFSILIIVTVIYFTIPKIKEIYNEKRGK